jgi:hypothetical protein
MFVHKRKAAVTAYIKVSGECNFKMLHIMQSLEGDHKYGQSCSQSNFSCTAPSEHLMDIIQTQDSQAK